MKWIAIAIVLFVISYTFISLYFRKPGPAHRPYQEARDRATVQRLESAGYQRAAAESEVPADGRSSAHAPKPPFAEVKPWFGGLSKELGEVLIDKPQLPLELSHVSAPAALLSNETYVIDFTCLLPDKSTSFAQTFLYVKDQELALVSSFEPIGSELQSRDRDCTVRVRIPPGTLKAGEYRLTLVGARGSQQWSLQVH